MIRGYQLSPSWSFPLQDRYLEFMTLTHFPLRSPACMDRRIVTDGIRASQSGVLIHARCQLFATPCPIDLMNCIIRIDTAVCKKVPRLILKHLHIVNCQLPMSTVPRMQVMEDEDRDDDYDDSDYENHNDNDSNQDYSHYYDSDCCYLYHHSYHNYIIMICLCRDCHSEL